MSPGHAFLGSGREQVDDLRVVATLGPRGNGCQSLSQVRPPKNISTQGRAIEGANFKCSSVGSRPVWGVSWCVCCRLEGTLFQEGEEQASGNLTLTL